MKNRFGDGGAEFSNPNTLGYKPPYTLILNPAYMISAFYFL